MIEKIISGGQTGVDRAALDTALELGIPCGGWCPKGRLAEDGVIPGRYPLVETGLANYWERTEKNVRDTDATLVLTRGKPTEGTTGTIEFARRHGKPCLVIDLEKENSPQKVREWFALHGFKVLNVAGPRESKMPGIYAEAKSFLKKILSDPIFS